MYLFCTECIFRIDVFFCERRRGTLRRNDILILLILYRKRCICKFYNVVIKMRFSFLIYRETPLI